MLSKEQLRRLGLLHKELSDIYLEASNTEETTTKVIDLPKEESTETVTEKVEKKEQQEVEAQEEAVEEDMNLESLSYNELKKLAKELSLSAKGTKAELIARIQEAQGIAVEDEEEEEEIVEEPTVEVEEETVEDEESDEEEDLTTLHDEVMEQLEAYTDEELKEILESIDKPTKGKRQTLIALIVQAIEEGLIDFGDEEEEESDEEQHMEQDDESTEADEEQGVEDEEEDEDEEDDTEEDEEDEIDIEEILSPLDRDKVKLICRKLEIKVLKKDTEESLKEKVMDFEDNDKLLEALIDLGLVSLVDDEDEEEDEEDEVEVREPNYTGSKKRIKAMKKVYAETLEDIEEGTIKPKTIAKVVKEYHNDNWTGTQEETNLEYARIKAELVDDDGDLMELAEAYYVGDDVYCCGDELKVVDGDYYCEHCGTTYADDEE